MAQGRLYSPPSLSLLCVAFLLEVARLLRRLREGQVAPRIAQLAGVLLDVHRLHVGSSMLWAMEGI
jgi:hypothetical protein